MTTTYEIHSETLRKAQIAITTGADLRAALLREVQNFRSWVEAMHPLACSVMLHACKPGKDGEPTYDFRDILEAMNKHPDSVWIPRISQWAEDHTDGQVKFIVSDSDGKRKVRVKLADVADRTPEAWNFEGMARVAFDDYRRPSKPRAKQTMSEHVSKTAKAIKANDWDADKYLERLIEELQENGIVLASVEVSEVDEAA